MPCSINALICWYSGLKAAPWALPSVAEDRSDKGASASDMANKFSGSGKIGGSKSFSFSHATRFLSNNLVSYIRYKTIDVNGNLNYSFMDIDRKSTRLNSSH